MTQDRQGPNPVDVAEALRVAFDDARDAIAILGPDGEIAVANAAFERLFGDAESGVWTRRLESLFVDWGEFLAATAAIGASSACGSAAATVQDAHGRTIVARVSAAPFARASSAQPGTVVTFYIENDDDDGVSPDEQRAIALERLAGGIAHDFRNVLAVIKGNVELAARRTSDPRVIGLLAEAERAANLGATMTEQLLSFARRGPERERRMDVNRTLAESAALLQASSGDRIALHIAASSALGQIEADESEFQRALINLVANARDAMPDGGTISIEARPISLEQSMAVSSGILSPGSYVTIAVIDTGSGMSPSVRRRALDPFFSTKAPGMGSGLGLALVSGFAADAGGGLDLARTPGGGTTAMLYLKAT
ncbi:MAG: two-component system sensor histidine kinase NtrB [Hyphomicrobium sp.]